MIFLYYYMNDSMRWIQYKYYHVKFTYKSVRNFYVESSP